MKTYQFSQFNGTFEAQDDQKALQLMDSISKLLEKYKDNPDTLLMIASHAINETKQFKTVLKLAQTIKLSK